MIVLQVLTLLNCFYCFQKELDALVKAAGTGAPVEGDKKTSDNPRGASGQVKDKSTGKDAASPKNKSAKF